MFARMQGSTIIGIEGLSVAVEVDVSSGLPGFEIVGMAGTALREAKHRVRSALRNSGFKMPAQRVTVSLAPAAVHKEGSQLDVAIALGVLAASGEIPVNGRLKDHLYLGELGLNGSLRPVKGALTMVVSAKETGVKCAVIPVQNGGETWFLEGIDLYVAENLTDLIHYIKGQKLPGPAANQFEKPQDYAIDLSEIHGQMTGKRALEVAAAGGHNLLMVGSPGSGKSMLAKAMPGILPKLSYKESLEVTRIHGVAGALPEGFGLVQNPPFRAPHHTVTSAAFIGGGAFPTPGEVTLAHRGVLFLDELPEFPPSVLNALRQPMEEGEVVVTRSKGVYTFPCRFVLVGAMNPCKCGWCIDDVDRCTCTESEKLHYASRVPGPLLDRIDLRLQVGRVSTEDLIARKGEESAVVRQRVQEARNRQLSRLNGTGIWLNSQMSPKHVGTLLTFSKAARKLALDAFCRMKLSSRGYYRVLKVAATVADLCSSPRIEEEHVGEALAYRQS